MTRAQLNKANEIESEISKLEEGRAALVHNIKLSFEEFFPAPPIWEKEKKDEYGELKTLIFDAIDKDFNARLRALEEQIAEL